MKAKEAIYYVEGDSRFRVDIKKVALAIIEINPIETVLFSDAVYSSPCPIQDS